VTDATKTQSSDSTRGDAGQPILSLSGLEVHFPIRFGFLDTILRRTRGVVRAVEGIDLELRAGELRGVVGE
jgi:ABC-type oligopeptide transport system ATPase subunit